MPGSAEMIEAFDARAKRRDFFKTVVGAAVVGAGGFAFANAASAQALTDNDILNFALNLEYLEAQFYSFAAFGTGLANSDLTGATGPQGAVTGGRQVPFQDPVVQQYAREIANDEIAHVKFLRAALGSAAVAQPAINIDGGPNGAFTAAARAAGVVPDTGTFDPYLNDNNFLLGAYIFEDVGVTAYKGASPLITNNTFLDAAAGILAVEAFHAGIIRGSLYAKGVDTPQLRTAADQISNARDSLDGTTGTTADLDQGISPVQTALTTSAGTTTATASNFVPTDANGVAFSRTTGQVLNIVYLTRTAATAGGFFPAGVNGTIRSSAAN